MTGMMLMMVHALISTSSVLRNLPKTILNVVVIFMKFAT